MIATKMFSKNMSMHFLTIGTWKYYNLVAVNNRTEALS
jgi:hypothetical protein